MDLIHIRTQSCCMWKRGPSYEFSPNPTKYVSDCYETLLTLEVINTKQKKEY